MHHSPFSLVQPSVITILQHFTCLSSVSFLPTHPFPYPFFLCCLYCSIPFSFQVPIHPCITPSVTCWWITVDVLSLTWWEISVTFSKGHHMNTQQTHALCPLPCTLACTHKGTHFHLTLSSCANEGTVKDLYTFPCLSFCCCLPSRFFIKLQKETFPSSTHPLYSFHFNYSLWFLPLHFFSEACWNSPPFWNPLCLFIPFFFCCWHLCCVVSSIIVMANNTEQLLSVVITHKYG